MNDMQKITEFKLFDKYNFLTITEKIEKSKPMEEEIIYISTLLKEQGQNN